MSESQIFEMVLPVLAPVLVGWLAVRLKLLAVGDAKPLTSAYLYIFLPALIIGHLAKQNLAALFDVRFILATLALCWGSMGSFFCCIGLGCTDRWAIVCWRLLRVRSSMRWLSGCRCC